MKPRTTLSLKRGDDAVGPERLQKLLSKAGLGSRRMIEERVLRGEIEVDGRPAAIGDALGEGQTIKLDGQEFIVRAITHEGPRVLAYNKPEGEVATMHDPEGRPTVFDRLPRLKGLRWISVGRLDLNTAGLLLFTTDGDLANRLMHPSHEVEREYMCRIHGDVSDDALKQLLKGVELEDGPAHFDEIEGLGGEGSNKWFKVILKEGRQREVRRLWDAVGAEVSRLKRVRYGVIELGKDLKRGWYRELEAEETAHLLDSVGLPMSTRTELRVVPAELARRQARGPQRDRPDGQSRWKREGNPAFADRKSGGGRPVGRDRLPPSGADKRRGGVRFESIQPAESDARPARSRPTGAERPYAARSASLSERGPRSSASRDRGGSSGPRPSTPRHAASTDADAAPRSSPYGGPSPRPARTTARSDSPRSPGSGGDRPAWNPAPGATARGPRFRDAAAGPAAPRPPRSPGGAGGARPEHPSAGARARSAGAPRTDRPRTSPSGPRTSGSARPSGAGRPGGGAARPTKKPTR